MRWGCVMLLLALLGCVHETPLPASAPVQEVCPADESADRPEPCLPVCEPLDLRFQEPRWL